jgi:hypothetical protein
MANPPAFSPKERVAMKKGTAPNIAPGALLLILVALLILLAVHKRLATAEEVEKAVAKVEYHAVRDSHSPVAIIAVVALFAFVAWIVVRGNRGEAKALPPAKGSSASEGRIGESGGVGAAPGKGTRGAT